MDRDSVSPGQHYHIRWSTGEVDWERHGTRAHAEQSAKRLARTDERYTIEQFGETCAQCRKFACRVAR